MEDDRTVYVGRTRPPPPDTAPRVLIKYRDGSGKQAQKSFTGSFSIGRDTDCDVQLFDDGVSRRHTALEHRGGRWFVRDLNSSNGTLIGGVIVDEAPLEFPVSVQLGAEGPVLALELLGGSASADPGATKMTGGTGNRQESVTQILKRALRSEADGEEAGLHTQIVRRAVALAQEKESRRYRPVIGIVVALLLVAVGVVGYQEYRLNQTRQLAVDLFYDMKALELQVAQLEDVVGVALERAQRDDIGNRKSRLAEMQERYESFMAQLDPLDSFSSEEDRLIFKMARLFGECELNMPRDFADEVKIYIKRWQSSPRLRNALTKLKSENYLPRIREVMAANGLPFQFVYLALQESNFNPRAIGPTTRWGIAKGMWQFIPPTGEEYGLKIGPLKDERVYDPDDERFDPYKASGAAARYLRYIYNGEAQASGLLVMASYNWGHNRVRNRMQRMPESPRDRNFWNLLKTVKIPQETYDYVFMIFSAAVIAENPELFGFDFSNPLRS